MDQPSQKTKEKNSSFSNVFDEILKSVLDKEVKQKEKTVSGSIPESCFPEWKDDLDDLGMLR